MLLALLSSSCESHISLGRNSPVMSPKKDDPLESRVRAEFCTNCGKALKSDAKFCGRCGAEV
jgi:predicted amidophosphoribosyltransferase